MTKSTHRARQRKFFSFIFHVALWLFPFISAAPVFAQLQIISRAPRLDDIQATAFADIRLGFNLALNTSAPATAIQVWGNFHGRYAGTLSYADANQTLVFTPSQNFVDGEEITVVVTTAISGVGNATLAQPYVWRFLVRTNLGSGNFARVPYDLESASPISGVNQEPAHLVPGDFDHDDFIDLAVVHHGANRITVLRNTTRVTAGQTLFTPIAPPLSTGNTPVHAVAANFNNDDHLDLAVVNFNGNSFQIFNGNGAGQFAAPQTIAAGSRPIHLLAQDFNGDGAADLAITLFGADRVDIFLNNGAGSFPATASQQLVAGFGPVSAAAWDYDQNGALDIIVANHGAKSLSTFYNSNGRGNFIPGSSLTLSIPPVDLVSGDIAGVTGNQAGDGNREIVALCSDLHLLGKQIPQSGTQSPLATSQLAIINFASNRLNLIETVSLPGYAQALTLCNVDTLDLQRGNSSFRPDRDLDVFYTRFRDDRLSALRNPDNQPFLNLTPVDIDTVTSAKAITHLDIDRDGDNDLVVSNYLENQLVIYLNQGERVPPCTPVDSLNIPVSLVDFGDVCVSRPSTRRLFVVNSGSLPFSFTTSLSDSINFGILPRRGLVPANGVLALTVTFTPGDTLPYQSNLFIVTNDGVNTTSCSVILRGRGVRAALAVDQLLDFGCIPPGQTLRRQLRIENTGNIPLVLSGAANSLPLIFVVPSLINQQIPPRSFIDVPIDFKPTVLGNFLDSLRITSSNNCGQPVTTVLLRGCGSFSGPTITSNDTLYATEDVLATYVATATDPDGTTPIFRFENLPSWLQQTSGNTVQGTPLEGNGNTSFTVIASDGVLEARLQVIVIVTPANDAPVFDPVTDKTVLEGNLLTFEVVARDPENNEFILSAQNLPAGATFPQTNTGRGQFSWRPALGTARAQPYTVTFLAREQNLAPPLSSSITVNITVLTRLPDLYIDQLEMTPRPVRLNQRVTITATFADSSAPALLPVIARLLVDNQTLADTLITGLPTGARVAFSRPFQFAALGRHSVESVIDVTNSVAESNENNNTQRLEFDVLPGQLNVAPNPFTPNNDGFNDYVTFGFGNVGVQSPQLKIFDLHGNLLKTLSSSSTGDLRWDGNDNSGRAQPPGPYLYLFLDADKKMASGYVVLAR
jgi:gliding motility-associated-like protein